MTYHYEMLGAERFQKFAQALLSVSFPNLQCYPLNQADGGRDATVRINGAGFVVFQVKYSATPHSKTERRALRDAIKSEAEKVKRLVSRGATAYYLITNVAGTAQPDVGSIDETNKILNEEFLIPSYCWWRDDIDSRVSANSAIKRSFPEILKGSDVLELLVGGGLEEYLKLKQLIAHPSVDADQESEKVNKPRPSVSNAVIATRDIGHGPLITVRLSSLSPNHAASGTKNAPTTDLTMLIDTGSSECCIDPVCAERLKLTIIERCSVASAAGVVQCDVYLANLELSSSDGTKQFQKSFRFLGVANLQSHGIDGLLGRALLKDFRLVYGPESVALEFVE
jgi:predicted aspartyl protease